MVCILLKGCTLAWRACHGGNIRTATYPVKAYSSTRGRFCITLDTAPKTCYKRRDAANSPNLEQAMSHSVTLFGNGHLVP